MFSLMVLGHLEENAGAVVGLLDGPRVRCHSPPVDVQNLADLNHLKNDKF